MGWSERVPGDRWCPLVTGGGADYWHGNGTFDLVALRCPRPVPSAVDPPFGERAGARGATLVRTVRFRLDAGAPGGGLLGLPGSMVGGTPPASERLIFALELRQGTNLAIGLDQCQ